MCMATTKKPTLSCSRARKSPLPRTKASRENDQTLTTGADGRASFYLDENTTYYWKETGLPTGYEYENGTAPGGSFKTPYYKNQRGPGRRRWQ